MPKPAPNDVAPSVAELAAAIARARRIAGDPAVDMVLSQHGGRDAPTVPVAHRAGVLAGLAAATRTAEAGAELLGDLASTPPKLAEKREQIPQLLRSLNRWCQWQLEPNPGGRPTKVPDQSTAKLQLCRRWQDVATVARQSDGGIGFVTTGRTMVRAATGEAQLVFVDIDACRERRTGKVEEWALAIVKQLGNSYTEVSPSGAGLRTVVAVVSVPANLKPSAKLSFAAPPGVNKPVGVQLFGLGPAGYVTMTGQRLEETSPDVLVLRDVNALIDVLGLKDDQQQRGTLADVVGSGPIPALEEITARVLKLDKGQQLIDADWKAVLPGKTASEVFHLLAGHALRAAGGHGETAVDWLVERTAWGQGLVDDCVDPGKYGRWKWVAKDVVRAAQRGVGDAPEELFEELPMPASPPLAPVDKAPSVSADVLVDYVARFAAVLALDDDGTLVAGLLARGRILNFAAGPKGGKSTLMLAMLSGFSLAVPRPFPGFGAPAKPLRILYLSENHPDDDAVTLSAFAGAAVKRGGDGVLRLLDRRLIPPEARASWRRFLRWVAELVKLERFDVVVFDSFEAWVPDLDDSNAAAQIAQTYADLTSIVAQGCNVAVVCVLHVKKAGGPTLDFDAMLGSTKFRASSDFNLMLVRHAPDDPNDTRVVLRREGRDPWGLIRRVCGRLPAGVPQRVRDRDHSGTTLFGFRLVGEIVVDASEREAPAMRYEPVPVPPEWQRAPRGTAATKLTREQERQLDDDVLEAACRLHVAEKGEKPVSPRRLVEHGFAERAAAQLQVPASYRALTLDRSRSAAERLLEAGRLQPHGKDGKQGVTPSTAADAFPPVAPDEVGQ